MPLKVKRNGGKFVIINLQSTKHDRKCDVKINSYVDDIMTNVCRILEVPIPEWSSPRVVLESQHSLTEQETKLVPHIYVDETLLKPCTSKTVVKTEVKKEEVKDEVSASNGCSQDQDTIKSDLKMPLKEENIKSECIDLQEESTETPNDPSQDMPCDGQITNGTNDSTEHTGGITNTERIDLTSSPEGDIKRPSSSSLDADIKKPRLDVL